MSRGKIEGKWNSKIPLIMGAISGAAGFVIGILSADHILNHQYHESSADLQKEVQYLKDEVHYLENEVKNLQHQLHDRNIPEEILFGKNNSYGISII